MSSNTGNNNNNDKTGDVISWVIIIILMFAVPPVGWIWLLIKLGVFDNKKIKSNNTGSSRSGITVGSSSNTVGSSSKSNAKAKRTRLDKKTGKGLSLFLLFLSLGFGIAGIVFLSNWLFGGLTNNTDLIYGTLYMLGAAVSFFSRNNVAHRFSRYKNYYAFIEGRGVVPISALMQISGLSKKAVIRDISAMINSGYLDSGTYIDNELECLVLSADEADKLRTAIGAAPVDASSDTDVFASGDVPQGQYAAYLAELREVNSFIKDEAISKKVSRLEELTGKIFKIVEETPQKQSQLRRFMSYYLPTTLKLVRSYATLEKQGVKGENIMSTKKSIGDILDTLSTGFEQQLDQLFKSDAIDIATDINVLENLMQQDGLTGDKSEFQVAQGGSF